MRRQNMPGSVQMRTKLMLEYRNVPTAPLETADTLWLPQWAYWSLVVATYLMILIAGSVLHLMLQ